MGSTSDRTKMVGRRGELLVELFLEDLQAEFVAQAEHSRGLGYDFFVGFRNQHGGVNTCAVVAKATEQPVGDRFRFPKRAYDQLSHSNIPVLLLVANVKDNRLYYAWIAPEDVERREDATVVPVPVTEIDDAAKQSIRNRLVG